MEIGGSEAVSRILRNVSYAQLRLLKQGLPWLDFEEHDQGHLQIQFI